MYFVDKQQVPLLQVRQQGRQIAGPLDSRPRRNAQVDAQLVGDDAGHRRLAQPRRTVQQHVIQRFLPQLCRLNKDF